jgi:RHS repeat-associated protein
MLLTRNLERLSSGFGGGKRNGFGEVRTDLPAPAYRITITDFGFTGQKTLMGLMDYHARFFDPGLARFISTDSIVPNAGNSMSWDRFAYVNGNPLSFIDPTGHFGKHREDRSDY